jgi:hypothetical protein
VAHNLRINGREYKNGLERLRNLESFKHNVKVWKRGDGELMVVGRSS